MILTPVLEARSWTGVVDLRRIGGTSAVLRQDGQFAGDVVEALGALLSDRHRVLDAHSPAIRDVDARLVRKDHAGLHRLGVALHQVGILMAGQADAVPQPVNEVLTVAVRGDDGPRRAVDVLTGNARFDRFECGLLRLSTTL